MSTGPGLLTFFSQLVALLSDQAEIAPIKTLTLRKESQQTKTQYF